MDDPLYVGLKIAVTMSECSRNSTDTAFNPIPEFNSLSISSAFKEVLTVPKPVGRKKTRVAAKLPSHLSGAEVIHILKDKKKKKKEEAAKAQRKAEREERRRQRKRRKLELLEEGDKKARAEGVVEEEAVEVAEQ